MRYGAAFGATSEDPLYATVSEGGRRGGMEHFLPLFYPKLETLFDYLPGDALIALDHLANAARDERLAMIEDAFEARIEADRARGAYHPLPADALYLTPDEWDGRIAAHPSRRFTPFEHEGAADKVDMGAKLGRTFAAERAAETASTCSRPTADHARRLSAAGKRVLFASWSDGASERLGAMLADHGLKDVRARALLAGGQGERTPKQPQRVVLPLDAGFETDRPGRHLRDRHPRRPPGALRPPAPGAELPGRGHVAHAGRPRRPHRPRHRPLRRPEDAGGAGRAARLPGDRLRRPSPSSTCRSRTSTS